jgi:hypothetical protein
MAAFNFKSQRFADPHAFRIDACGLQRAYVQKYIRPAGVVLDETEAAVGVPNFQRAGSHALYFNFALAPADMNACMAFSRSVGVDRRPSLRSGTPNRIAKLRMSFGSRFMWLAMSASDFEEAASSRTRRSSA